MGRCQSILVGGSPEGSWGSYPVGGLGKDRTGKDKIGYTKLASTPSIMNVFIWKVMIEIGL